jgi:cobalamin-dependent methionine synthase I
MEQQKRTGEAPAAKRKRARNSDVTVDLNDRIARAMEDVLVTSIHGDLRQKCLQTLQVQNGSEAGEKIKELLEKFKGNKRQKAIKENSEKINENSP